MFRPLQKVRNVIARGSFLLFKPFLEIIFLVGPIHRSLLAREGSRAALDYPG